MNGNGERAPGAARSYGDLLRLCGVHKFYGGGVSGVHALNGVELQLAPGEVVSICGPSGSGKTSLINLVSMLEPATEGGIIVASLLTGRLTEQARADLRAEMIGLVFQNLALVPVMTARENVLLPVLLRGLPNATAMQAAQARADELLGQMGLSTQADQRPGRLDPSQNQRVAIARALIGKPRLVLADEPTARLDGASTRIVLDLFAREQAQHGTAFLITTRDQRQLGGITRTLQLNNGRLLSAADASTRKPFRTPA